MDYEIRKPSAKEIKLIKYLVEKAAINVPNNWENELAVKNMKDGKMGSLYLYLEENSQRKTAMTCISEVNFKDQDDILVIASLYIDSNGNICELDIWKTDFTPLLSYPDF